MGISPIAMARKGKHRETTASLPTPRATPSPWRYLLPILVSSVILCVLGWTLYIQSEGELETRSENKAALAVPFDADRSFEYLEKICALGPRISGSPEMNKQQELLIAHFDKLEAKVKVQDFDVPHPLTKEPVMLSNLIVEWHPEAKERLLICCHYDTRPYADQEFLPANKKKPFLGANDGASGVALLMELGHHMSAIECSLGVDFVFFDAEEFVFGRGDDYFLGSQYFADQYRDSPPNHVYQGGILLDMVADKKLNIRFERNSYEFAPKLTKSIWATAKELDIREFRASMGYEVLDDHIPLNKTARIPTTDIIDFDYPYWHTLKDIPSNCSGESMKKVASVLINWLPKAKESLSR